jgi:hypothetical protein
MTDIFHLYCRHCGEGMKRSPSPYCRPCNLDLCYRAMPLLLGMMMTGHIKLATGNVDTLINTQKGRRSYDHLRYILD